MGRSTQVLSFSVPENTAKDIEQLAKQQRMSRSQLLREMLRVYETFIEEARFRDIQTYAKKKAKTLGISSEKDIERLIREARSA